MQIQPSRWSTAPQVIFSALTAGSFVRFESWQLDPIWRTLAWSLWQRTALSALEAESFIWFEGWKLWSLW
jgi:hypothetical protein